MPRIALEGLPGAGKTSVSKLLAKKLGYEVIDEILYPVDNVASDHRAYLLHDVAKHQMMRSCAHAVMDRTYLSTLAVTRAKADANSYELVNLYAQELLTSNKLMHPDVLFYLRIPLHTSLSRQNKTNQSFWFDEAVLTKVSEYYEDVFSGGILPCPVVVIDATMPPRAVFNRICAALEEHDL